MLKINSRYPFHLWGCGFLLIFHNTFCHRIIVRLSSIFNCTGATPLRYVSCLRSYDPECIQSHLIQEGKQDGAWLVLGWEICLLSLFKLSQIIPVALPLLQGNQLLSTRYQIEGADLHSVFAFDTWKSPFFTAWGFQKYSYSFDGFWFWSSN